MKPSPAPRATLVDRAVAGQVVDLAVATLDEVDAWHAAMGGGTSLADWLGLSTEEYADFVHDDEALARAVAARTRT